MINFAYFCVYDFTSNQNFPTTHSKSDVVISLSHWPELISSYSPEKPNHLPDNLIALTVYKLPYAYSVVIRFVLNLKHSPFNVRNQLRYLWDFQIRLHQLYPIEHWKVGRYWVQSFVFMLCWFDCLGNIRLCCWISGYTTDVYWCVLVIESFWR